MKKITLFFAVILFVFGVKQSFAQCNDYSILSATEDVTEVGGFSSISSLFTCHQYNIKYELQRDLLCSSVDDNITINLPLGITFEQLGTCTGATVTYNPLSDPHSPVFIVSGWGTTDNLVINIIVRTAACDGSGGSQTTVIDYCDPAALYSQTKDLTIGGSLAIPNPVLNVTVEGPPTIMLNTGDVSEFVFEITNSGPVGSVISQVNIAYNANSNVDFFLSSYYVSTSSTILDGNFYTYSLPLGTILHALPTLGNDIIIDGGVIADAFLNASILSQQKLYVHIPYIVSYGAAGCGETTGTYDFSSVCALTGTTCETISKTTIVKVLTGTPNLSSVAPLPIDNATFCPAGNNTATLEFNFTNNGTSVAGAPHGNAKIVDLKLYWYLSTELGNIDLNSLKIYNNNSHTWQSLSSNLFVPYPYSPDITAYCIDFSNLLPVSGNFDPFGNGLKDLDGDGMVDDISEYAGLSGLENSFKLRVDFIYSACPTTAFSSCSSHYSVSLATQSKYQNQCNTLTDVHTTGFSITNTAEAAYYYAAGSSGASISAPADIVQGDQFNVDICPKNSEYWFPTGFDFDCPNGYHNIHFILPYGVHLNTSGLTPHIGGGYDLPPVIVADYWGTNQHSITPYVVETPATGTPGASNCTQGYLDINFGRIPGVDYGPYYETLFLPCMNIPLTLTCDDACGANFGFDNLSYTLQYICDPTCTSCASNISCAQTDTYHHCNGACVSYFSTDQNSFSFLRKNIGTDANSDGTNYQLNPTIIASTPLTSTNDLDLSAAYSGDVIEVKATGSFAGTPDPGNIVDFPPIAGSDFSSIYLQVRYNDLGAAAANPVIFDYDGSNINGHILITEHPGGATYSVAAQDIVFITSIVGGEVLMNFSLSAGGKAFIANPANSYSFEADLFLKVKAQPNVNYYTTTFFTGGTHNLVHLRAEFMGTETTHPGKIDNSCDSWGANFAILQPGDGITYYPGYFGSSWIDHPSCDDYYVNFILDNAPARFSAGLNDFPNELRAYCTLDPNDTIELPMGYQYESSVGWIIKPTYTPGGINDFTVNAGPYSFESFLINPVSVTIDPVTERTKIIYNGPNTPELQHTWPLLDDKYCVWYPSLMIQVRMQPMCDALAQDHFDFNGSYTEGAQQPDVNYQVQTKFQKDFPVYHVNPIVNVVTPNTINAYSNPVTFQFQYCNEPGPNAPNPWITFESPLDTYGNPIIDFTNLTITGGGSPLTLHPITNGVLVYLPAMTNSTCTTFTLTANVIGCVPVNGGSMEYDIAVHYGNDCIAPTEFTSNPSCLQGTTNFTFNLYPSDISLTTVPGSFPPAPVPLNGGLLDYDLVISSSLDGSVTNPTLGMFLPTGITVQNTIFYYPCGTVVTNPNLTTVPAGNGSNLTWDLNSIINPLPGVLDDPNNKICVHLTLQTDCSYDNGTISFQAGGLSTCNEPLTSNIITHQPVITDPLSALTISANPNPICAGTSTTLTAYGASTYVWSDGLGNNNPVTVTPANTTTYTVTGTMEGGCTTTASITVVVNPDLQIAISAIPDQICEGSSTLLTASGASDFVWSTGSILNPITVSPTATTQYSVTGTMAGCSGTGTITVTVHPNPIVSFSKEIVRICSGECHTLYPNVQLAAGETISSYAWSSGELTSPINACPLITTNYTVTVTTDNGCTGTASKIIYVNPSPVVVISPSSAAICLGEDVTLTASGADTYEWSTDDTYASITVNPTETTTYTVTGTSLNCTGTAEVTVIVNPLPVINVNDAVVCYGTDAILTATGASTYVWSNGATTATIAVHPNITYSYTVTGTDLNGCQGTAVATVSYYPRPTIQLTGDTICAGESATLYASGGVTYDWGSGWTTVNSITVSPTTTTMYSVTATDANGCTGLATATVTVQPPLTINVSGNLTICNGQGTVLTASGATNYNWSGGLGTNNSITVNPTTTTNYTVTGSTGACTGSAMVTVSVYPRPNIQLSSATICAGNSVTLYASGGVSYDWGSGETFMNTITVSPTTTTTYTVTAIDANNCTGTAIGTVTVNSNPIVTATADNLFNCIGSPTTITASGASNYLWSSGQSTPSITVTPPVGSNTYTVTGTDNNGCHGSASVTLIVDYKLSVSVNSAQICNGQSATLIANGATTYTWSPATGLSSTTGSTVTASPTSTTTYTVTGTAGPGCSNFALAVVTVKQNPSVGFISPPANLCSGSCTTLNLMVAIPIGSTLSGYHWNTGVTSGSLYVCPTTTTSYAVTITTNFGCTASASTTINVIPSPVVSVNSVSICSGDWATLTASGADSYNWSVGGSGSNNSISVHPHHTTTYTVTGTSTNGCTASATAVVTVNPLPNVIASAFPNPVLYGGSVILSASGASTYIWSTGDIGTPVTVGPLFSTTNYLVTGTDNNGCQNTDMVKVKVKKHINDNKMSESDFTSADSVAFLIYPNPATEKVIIESENIGSSIADFELYNTLGSLVISCKLENSKTQIPVANLPDGVYYYRISLDGRVVSNSKLVIMR
jgi:hypothetical protein